MKNNEAAGFDLRGDRLHQAAAVSGPVAGSQLVDVFRIEAIRAVVGVAGAADFLAAVSTGEIFGDFDKSHFGDRIAQVEKLIKRDDPEGWNRGADSN